MRLTRIVPRLRVMLIDADRHSAAQTARFLAQAGHWVRCGRSAAAALTAAHAHRFDVLLVNTASFTGDAELLVRQIRTLYPVAAVELGKRPHWFGRHPVPHAGFDASLAHHVTAARLADVLRHIAEPAESQVEFDDQYGGFAPPTRCGPIT